MPTRPKRPCAHPGCPELTDGTRCPEHQRQYDRRRGTAAQRGYAGKAWQQCRIQVLVRDPWCTACRRAPSTDADHYPRTRRELVRLNLDPNDPMFCRGVCHRCHSRHTAVHDGGFGNGIATRNA